ncbi:MAG: glutamate synthase [Candidatus Parabeggiatoa sp. nov. 1]|nr:MAG: glutamate synthase [Gammaproteobacteria bacterium]
MNISGVLVHARPEQVAQVEKQLTEIPGVEVHAVTENGRLVVTVEQDNDKMIADTVLNIHNCEGVLSAAMVYQYGDDDTEVTPKN